MKWTFLKSHFDRKTISSEFKLPSFFYCFCRWTINIFYVLTLSFLVQSIKDVLKLDDLSNSQHKYIIKLWATYTDVQYLFKMLFCSGMYIIVSFSIPNSVSKIYYSGFRKSVNKQVFWQKFLPKIPFSPCYFSDFIIFQHNSLFCPIFSGCRK